MKQRRVGTITLGLALIMIGVLIPVSLFYPEMAGSVMKFSPIILVALGIEVLVYAIWFRNEKLIYDGLSVFLAIIITLATVAASYISPIVDRATGMAKLHAEVLHTSRADMRQFLKDEGINGSVEIGYSYDDFYFFIEEPNDERLELEMRFYLNYPEEASSKKENIAKDIVKIVNRIEEDSRITNSIYFNIEAGAKGAYIRMPNNISGYSLKDIEKMIVFDRQVEYYD